MVLFQEEITMKQGIHPDYKVTTVHCACGESFQSRSTKENVKLDICSVCHPFFTGKQKLIDTEGRVDKFRKKYQKA
jgi:large subunit ribosomal protein L31